MSRTTRKSLYSTRVLLPDGLTPATIFIEDNKITGVLSGKSQDQLWPLDDLGDLVIMPGHDGFYAGNGNILHAPYEGASVRVQPIWTSDYYIVRIGI